MRSAELFFPRSIMLLMNFVTSRSWYLGAVSTSRRRTSPLRGMISSSFLFRRHGQPQRVRPIAVVYLSEPARREAAPEVAAGTRRAAPAAAPLPAEQAATSGVS